MRLVKINDAFFVECKVHNTEKELLFNENGRPSVLIVQLKYKGAMRKFVVPLRSNISPSTPREQYFSLPPNRHTKTHHSHGIHYIKLFPIKDEYVETYLISSQYDLNVKKIIDSHEDEIVKACQNYLEKCEKAQNHFMTPDIDGILKWMDEKH